MGWFLFWESLGRDGEPRVSKPRKSSLEKRRFPFGEPRGGSFSKLETLLMTALLAASDTSGMQVMASHKWGGRGSGRH